MTSSPHGNHADTVHAFGVRSRITYVPGSAERNLRMSLVGAAIVVAFLAGFAIGGQPGAYAACGAIHSADTCALALR